MENKEIAVEEPTTEQCKKFIEALKSQNTQLIYQLQNSNMTNMFKRLDYLFKVVENANMFDVEFVDQCVDEIKDLMTPPEVEEKEEE